MASTASRALKANAGSSGPSEAPVPKVDTLAVEFNTTGQLFIFTIEVFNFALMTLESLDRPSLPLGLIIGKIQP
jgi:hypothetical protein